MGLRVLLLSANREKVPYPVLPIGLGCVASALHEAGHTVAVEDLCFARSPLGRARGAVASFAPDLVGIGLRNMDNCDFYATKNFLPEAREIVRACRSASGAPIVIGGSAVSVMPEGITEMLRPDFAVAGEGEAAMVALAGAIEDGRDPAAIPGVWTLERDGVRRPPPRRAVRLERLPPPRIFRWVDVRPYMRCEGVYPLQSKRGCALECVYCTYAHIEGKRYRFRSGESVADEVGEIHEATGVRDFEFVDSTFNAPPHHALEVCGALAERNLPVRFIGNGLNPVATTPELLAAMKAAGFHALVCTAESASDPVLRNLRKGFDRAHLESVARSTRELGLPTLWIFLIGGPGESRQTVEETFDFIRASTGAKDVAYVTSGIRIYPNTALETIAASEGFLRDRRELLEPRFYFSPGLDAGWLRGFLMRRAREDPRIVTSEMSQSRLVPIGLRLLGALGVRKPFWRFAPLLNRTMRWVG